MNDKAFNTPIPMRMQQTAVSNDVLTTVSPSVAVAHNRSVRPNSKSFYLKNDDGGGTGMSLRWQPGCVSRCQRKSGLS